jgi:mannose-6-phosphate isomerase-like protein (cupin superfamily)
MQGRVNKPWGWSQEVYRDELTRVVRIHVEPGGFCSVHFHASQVNRFIVLSGELTVHKAGETTELSPHWHMGSYSSIKCGVSHHFHNATSEPVEALEIYTSANGTPPDESDIIRLS